MKKISVFFITGLTALTLACPLFASEEYGHSGMKGEHEQSARMGQTMEDTSEYAQKIMGMEVVTEKGEKIGKITDVKIDQQADRITYVTISQGGILGMGGKEIPVPLEAFHIHPKEHIATLAVDQNKLKNVPKQANMSDESFMRQLESHYGISPAWEKQKMQEGKEHMMMEQEEHMGGEKSGY